MNKAFTVVELIVVIGVISILAVIGVVSYGAWREQSIGASVKANLSAASSAMEAARNEQDGFPGAIPGTFKASDGVTVTLFSASAKTYCLDGTALGTNKTYYLESANKNDGAQEGTCNTSPNSPLPLAPQNVGFVTKNQTELTVNWSALPPPTPISYTVQCATDPVFINGKRELTVTHPTVTANFTGLSAQSSYFCRVRANSGSGAGAWSTMVNTDTNIAYGSMAVGTSIEGYWTSAPQGFLLEDGSAVSRTVYADLFALIGTKFGSGDGSTTFNLPNSRGKATIGRDTRDADYDQVGDTSGAKTHTLTIAEMPAHTHTQSAHTHTQAAHGHTLTNPGHNHTQASHNHTQDPHNHNSGLSSPFVSTAWGSATNTAHGGNYDFRWGFTSPSTTATNNATTATNNSASTNISIGSATATNNSATATNQNAGSGSAHANIQPSIVKTSAIKYSAPDTNAPSQPEGSSISGYWASAPSGYLLEDGAEVSRTTYAALFAVLGTTHGAGNGSTTFNLPDSRGRFAVALSSSEPEFNTIGKRYGNKTELIDIASMPSHTHTQNAHTHTQNNHSHSITDPGHTHTQNAHTHTQNAHNHNGGFTNPYVGANASLGGSAITVTSGSGYGLRTGSQPDTTATNNAATATNNATTTGVTVYTTTAVNNSTVATNQDTGGNSPHNNMQPGIAKTTAIKAIPSPATATEMAPGTSISGYWSAAPSGYLIEDGSAVSRSTYANLFAVIGTTYGTGNGSTTFNLPDSKGRISVNRSSLDTEFDTMGEKAGTKTVTLSLSELPSHTHIQDAHNHTQNAHTHSIYDPAHNHTQNSHNHTQNAHSHSGHVANTSFGGTSAPGASGGSYSWRWANMPNVTATNQSTTATNNSATTGITMTATPTNNTNNSTTAVNQNTGGGGAHNNVGASIVRLFVIKI